MGRDGRCWNSAVETFVNLEPNLTSPDLVSIEGDIPESVTISRLDLKALPAQWHQTRDESLHRFGDDWVRAGATVALLVPSAAILGEWNVLLNPAHPVFAQVHFQSPKPFEFDARMFR